MKFLAVLAVLAMALAAFAVIAPTEEQNADVAGSAEYFSPGNTSDVPDVKLIETSAETLAAGSYVITGAVGIVSTAETGSIIIYVEDTKTLTITAVSGTATVKVIPVTVGEGNKLALSSDITMTFVTGTDAATFNPTSATAATIGGTSVVSAGKVPGGTTLTIAANAKVTVTGVLTNNGTIANNTHVATNTAPTEDYYKGNVDGIIVDGADAKITGSGSGIINGTSVVKAFVHAGTIEYQTIVGGVDSTNNEEKGASPIEVSPKATSTATLQHLVIKHIANGYGIAASYGAATGNAVFDDITYESKTGAACAINNLVGYSSSTEDADCKLVATNFKLGVGVSIRENYSAALLINKNGATIAKAGSSVAADVKVDTTLSSLRVANNLVIADNIAFEDGIMSRGTKTITVNEGKTLTGDLTNGEDMGFTALKIILNNGSSYVGTVTHESSTGPSVKTIATFNVTSGAADSEIYSVAATPGVNMKGIIEGTIGGNVTVAAGDALTISPAAKTLTVAKGGNLNLTTSTLNGPGTLAIEQGAFLVDTVNHGEAPNAPVIKYAGASADTTVVTPAANNGAIENAVATEGKTTVIVNVTAGSSAEATVAVGSKNVTINLGADVEVENLDFTVTTGGSLAINVTSAGAAYSGTITAGTQKITMDGVTGEFTITAGSIVIDGEVKGGTITLDNGAILKVKETLVVTGAATITTEANKYATVVIEESAVATLNAELTIGERVTAEIHGKVTGTAGFADSGKIVIYPEADVYELIGYAIDAISGNDGNGGTWEYDADDDKLTLTNYNGFAYFGTLRTVTDIILVGDNVITLTDIDTAKYGSAIFTASGDLTIKNLSGDASLTVTVSVKSGDLFYGINAGANSVDIKGVDVAFAITGSATTAYGIKTSGGAGKNVTLFNTESVFLVNPSAYMGDLATPAGSFGIYAYNVTIQSSIVDVDAGFVGIYAAGKVTIDVSAVAATASQYGIKAVGTMDVTQSSSVELESLGLTVGKEPAYALSLGDKLTNLSHSEISVNGMYLTGADNYADLTNIGNAVITGIFANKTEGNFVNSGVIGIYGAASKLDIAEGTFVNDGTLSVYKTPGNSAVNHGFGVGTNVYAYNITITNENTVSMTANGVASVQASVTLKQGDDILFGGAQDYFGTVTTDSSGNILAMDLKRVTVNAGVQYISSVILTTAAGSTEGNLIYNVVTSGTVYQGGAAVNTVGTVTEGGTTGIVKIAFTGAGTANTAVTVSGGEFTNNGKLNINSANVDLITEGKITNKGTLSVGANININGGDLINEGTMTVGKNKSVTVTKGLLDGDFSLKDGASVTVVGSIDSTIKYAGTYKYTAPGATTPVDTPFSNVLGVIGKGATGGFTITATTNANAPSTLNLTSMDKVNATSGAGISISEGKVMLSSEIVGAKAEIEVLSGATLQVVGTADVKGVIAVQDGATFNRWIDNVTETYTYGKATYVIEFANNGYTYYGNLAFALENAPENAEMTLSSTTVIDKTTEMKKGVILTFANGVNLAIRGAAGEGKDIAFTMGEDAKFVMPSGSVLSFQYATISAVVDYADNEIVLDKVVVGATEATITAKAGSSVVPAGFDFASWTLKDGTIEATEGYVYGAITLGADLVPAVATPTAKNFGKIIVGEDAVLEAVITAGDNPKFAALEINGEFDLAANYTASIPITGDGEIVLGDNVVFTSADNIALSIAVGNGFDGFILDKVKDQKFIDDPAQAHVAYTIKSVPKSGTVEAYVQIGGTVAEGTVTAVGNTNALNFNLKEDAIFIVPDEAILTIATSAAPAQFIATGLLKVAGIINMFTTETTTYGVVDYQVVYEDGIYDVYTQLASAAAKAPAGTDFELSKNLEVADLTLNTGNTITIADGKKLTVTGVLTVGNAPTSLGAIDAIVGKVVLAGVGNTAYAIVYSGADVSGATFVYIDGDVEKAAKISNYSIENVTYADIYANVNVLIENVNVEVGSPQIPGLKFGGWVAYNTELEHPKIGDCDVYAKTVAVQYKVTVKSVTGVIYKLNGTAEAIILDTPFYVNNGAVINAVAASGYQGTTQSWTVDQDMTITASGFTPIPTPEPTPEPTAGGISLTDILLIVLVILIAVMVVIMVLRLNRS